MLMIPPAPEPPPSAPPSIGASAPSRLPDPRRSLRWESELIGMGWVLCVSGVLSCLVAVLYLLLVAIGDSVSADPLGFGFRYFLALLLLGLLSLRTGAGLFRLKDGARQWAIALSLLLAIVTAGWLPHAFGAPRELPASVEFLGVSLLYYLAYVALFTRPAARRVCQADYRAMVALAPEATRPMSWTVLAHFPYLALIAHQVLQGLEGKR